MNSAVYTHARRLPSQGMPRMTTHGKRIVSPVTDPINRKTTAYKAHRLAQLEAKYQREFKAWLEQQAREQVAREMLDAARAQANRLSNRAVTAMGIGKAEEVKFEQAKRDAMRTGKPVRALVERQMGHEVGR